jgi:arsenate reductase (thioredoxin)
VGRLKVMNKIVIFACVHNAGRSQMAAAFFNQAAPQGWEAVSAGTQPADRVHPVVAEVMREVGIDLTAPPRLLTHELASGASLLITMGCKENCPYVSGLTIRDWKLEDPKGQPLDQVRAIRDDIRRRVGELQQELSTSG